MCDNKEKKLRHRHSFCNDNSSKEEVAYELYWKSDVNLLSGDSTNIKCYELGELQVSQTSNIEYYKRYELDEIPVKENSDNSQDSGNGDANKAPITDSDLDRLEMKVYNNISQEIKTNVSMVSLDSSVKLFRTTVQEIFDNFYKNMHDFEQYKRKFHEILANIEQNSIVDMENFIKDMIQSIITSESAEEIKSTEMFVTYDKEAIENASDKSDVEISTPTSGQLLGKLHSIVNSYKIAKCGNFNPEANEYTSEENSRREECFNYRIQSEMPFDETKINNRHLMSEVHIGEGKCGDNVKRTVASAENLEKIAAKKIEMLQYSKLTQQCQESDREIPVRNSYAKKNIYLNEDFVYNSDDDDTRDRSFIAKVCSYICRKLRRSSIV